MIATQPRTEVIGDATLILGDCRDVLPTLTGVDAVVTDPPYGDGFAGQPTKWQRRAGALPQSWDDATPNLCEILDLAWPTIIWGGNRYPLPLCRGWLCWFKPDAPPSMGHFELAWNNLGNCARQISWSISATNSERAGQPTQKPVRVMEWCLGFVPNSPTILDPFMGSGTTGVACARLGRKFVGIEIEPSYFDIARRRIEEAQRQKDLFIHRAFSEEPVRTQIADLFFRPA